jgi:hypothetical protein
MIGGLVSLVWCLFVLALSFTRATPGTSLFPEIDFASKVGNSSNPSHRSLQHVLSTLSTSSSHKICEELARSMFYVRPSVKQEDQITANMECQHVSNQEIIEEYIPHP